MRNNANRFRTCLFGGFSKDDVIKYILKLAQERNESADAKDDLVKNVQSFRDTVTKLLEEVVDVRHEIEEIKKFKHETIEEVDDILSHIETAATDLHETIDSISEQYDTHTLITAGSIDRMLPILEESCKQFDEEFADLSKLSRDKFKSNIPFTPID
jgi:uncharacterized coiled-coil DUF342 family protein